MALVSILHFCQLSDSHENIEFLIDHIMINAEDGKLQHVVSRDLFVENAMKVEIIQHSLHRDKSGENSRGRCQSQKSQKHK